MSCSTPWDDTEWKGIICFRTKCGCELGFAVCNTCTESFEEKSKEYFGTAPSLIMLISSAFMQSMSAFVAQNYGAGRMKRARKALHYGVAVSFAIAFFHGDVLAGIFASEAKVIQVATSLFYIGLATPVSSILQLILCVGFMLVLKKQGVLEDMGKE